MNSQDDNQNKGGFPGLTSPFVAWGICVSTFFASQAYAELHPAPVSLAAEKTTGQIETVFAFYEQMPSGVAVSDSVRVFVNFPRWGDNVVFTACEIVCSELVPYPIISIYDFDPTSPSTM